jgi:LPLT family lysophospholipid transporter-like MFS transporter
MLPSNEASRMPRGFFVVLGAQFVSALADNALLIVTIATLMERNLAPWWAPMLKFSFTASYVLLAPVVGTLADAIPKGRLMGLMSAVKIGGVLMIVSGLHPAIGFGLVGLGAAAYAPAKYGLITELVPARQLVVANGWLEMSVVCAALIGTVVGGVLVSPWLIEASAVRATSAWLNDASPLTLSLCVILGLYIVSVAMNLAIKETGARYASGARDVVSMISDFIRANSRLWSDPEGRLSLAATTVVWGVGATLQFIVLKWATEHLGLSLDGAAYLQASVAIGVVIGAVAAGRFVPLTAATLVIPIGIVLGAAIPLLLVVDSVPMAITVLAMAGAAGGLLVVPLNALLQHRGHTLLTAGRSIAVQGCNENASVLIMLAVYGGILAADVPLKWILLGFGALIALAMSFLAWEGIRLSRCAVRGH